MFLALSACRGGVQWACNAPLFNQLCGECIRNWWWYLHTVFLGLAWHFFGLHISSLLDDIFILLGCLLHSLKASCAKIFYDTIYNTTAYSHWNSKKHIHNGITNKVLICCISSENIRHDIPQQSSVWRTRYAVFMVPIKPAVICSKLPSSRTPSARYGVVIVIQFYLW